MDSKQILYVDMDGVLVDFDSGVAKLSDELREKYKGQYDNVPGIFSLMDPMPNAIESFNILFEKYDTYVLSSPSYENSTSFSDKFLWVCKYLPQAKTKLILTKFKNLSKGHILIDDRTTNGASEFEGLFIHFGSEKYPNWDSVMKKLI